MITDGLSPASVLLLLALVGGSGAAAVACATALLCRRVAVATLVAKLAGAGLAVYAGLLLLGSLSSEDRVLGLNEEKHICEVDCHLAYSVVGVKRTGTVVVVTVKVRFDERTISPHRGPAPLTPNGRYVALVDGRDRRYRGATDGLRRQLVPGESYATDIAFAVPPDARDLRLILSSPDIETRLLIGHENSFFHGTTTFRLGA